MERPKFTDLLDKYIGAKARLEGLVISSACLDNGVEIEAARRRVKEAGEELNAAVLDPRDMPRGRVKISATGMESLKGSYENAKAQLTRTGWALASVLFTVERHGRASSSAPKDAIAPIYVMLAYQLESDVLNREALEGILRLMKVNSCG